MTATFSVLVADPSNSSNLARKGASAGLDPRRALGALSEGLRFNSCSPTDGRRALGVGSSTGFIERLFIALIKGEGGREDPGVETGDTARDPGRDASWNPRGDAGAVEGGESERGVPVVDMGWWSDSVDWEESAEGFIVAKVG